MTQEWIIKTMVNLGFRQHDAEVYAFLSFNGTHKAADIAEALKTNRRQVYRILKRLQNQKAVSRNEGLPACFSAQPFDKILDYLKVTSFREVRRMEQNMGDILALWNAATKKG